MKNVAFLRVSTNNKELVNQKLAIFEYAHKRGMKISKFMEVKIPSKKRVDKHL